MKRIVVMVCSLLAFVGLTSGCDDTRSGTDSGTIMLMDSGARDAGARDAGGGGGCTVTGFMPLPAGCLPRCNSATATTANACASQPTPEARAMCQSNAFMADTTPATTLNGLSTGPVADFACIDCFIWQLQTCWAESCPTELQAWAMCDPDTADCTAQETALDTCLMTNSTAVNACANTRVNACFGASGGFLPDLAPRELAIDGARFDAFFRRYPTHAAAF